MEIVKRNWEACSAYISVIRKYLTWDRLQEIEVEWKCVVVIYNDDRNDSSCALVGFVLVNAKGEKENYDRGKINIQRTRLGTRFADRIPTIGKTNRPSIDHRDAVQPGSERSISKRSIN